MVPAELDGVRLKILRAAEHMYVLQEKIAEFYISHAYAAKTEFDPNLGKFRTSVWITDKPDPMGTIIGDFLHNLRSALDHLARAIVIHDGAKPSSVPGCSTQFPILTDRIRDEAGQVVPVTIFTKRGTAISDESRAILEDVQPYSCTQGDPKDMALAVLSKLNNIDKHRLLHGVVGRFGEVRIRCLEKETSRVISEEVVARNFKGGTLTTYTDCPPGLTVDEVEVHPQFSPQITLDVPPPLGDRQLEVLLTELYEVIRDDVAERFARERFGGSLELNSLGL